MRSSHRSAVVGAAYGLILVASVLCTIDVNGQQGTVATGLPGRLLMFPPPVSDYETESTPYTMDLSTGELSPMPIADPQLPDWYLPVVYDELANSVYFVVNRGHSLGRLDLNSPTLRCKVIEPIGQDSDLVGISPAVGHSGDQTTLSNLNPKDSFFVGRRANPFGGLVDVYAPSVQGAIFYLAYASKQRAVYSIVTSWHRFKNAPTTALLDPTSRVDSAAIVERVTLRLIRVDSIGHIKASRELKPVVYIGIDVSPDGRWCALPEPLDPNSENIDFTLLDLLTDSIVSPDLGAEYNLSCPVFSSDGRFLAAIGRSRLNSRQGVFISKTPTFDKFELLHEYSEGDVGALTWSPDSEYLMIGVTSSLTANIFQGLEAIHVPTRTRRQVPVPKITQPEETVLLSNFQQYTWIK